MKGVLIMKRNILMALLLIIITYVFSYRITMHLVIPEILNPHQINLRVYGISDIYYVE